MTKGLWLRRLYNRWRRFLSPGWGSCLRCGIPWNFTRYHLTWVSDQEGMFPLCERCWLELKYPTARLPYYRTLAMRQDRSLESWGQIRTAVMSGK